MLEKYLAPWGNKVPWINRVIDLEAKVLSLGKRLSAALTENRSLHQYIEHISDELNRMKDREYDRSARPIFAAVDQFTRVDFITHHDDMYRGTVMQYRVVIDDFRIAQLCPSEVKYFGAKVLLENKERAAREFGVLFMDHIEQQIKRNLIDG